MKDTDPRKKVLEYNTEVINEILKDWSKRASDTIDPDEKLQWNRGIEKLLDVIKKFEEELKDP